MILLEYTPMDAKRANTAAESPRAQKAPDVPVRMDRDHLNAIPGYPLPPGYRIASYTPGDEEAWLRIHLVADKLNHFRPDTFRRQFGDHAATIAARQLYLFAPDGEAVGTTTAWFDGTEGRIHWVAIDPRYQGLGLSKPLLERACVLLRSLGHRRAYLTTSTQRVAAIGLYAAFGFTPTPRSDREAAAWRIFD